MDHRGHQTQHAACPLEFVERRPIVVESVEHLRVDRVSHLDAAFVISFAAFRRELLLLRAVQFDEGVGNRVASNELVSGKWLKQSAPNDLEALVWAGWAPGCLDPTNCVFQAGKGLAPAFPANLDVGDTSFGLLM